jgi:integrase
MCSAIRLLKCSTIILTDTEGKPWTSDGFRASWGKACKAVGIAGVTFHDLRSTAVTRPDVPRRKSRPLPAYRCATCAQSLTAFT